MRYFVAFEILNVAFNDRLVYSDGNRAVRTGASADGQGEIREDFPGQEQVQVKI